MMARFLQGGHRCQLGFAFCPSRLERSLRRSSVLHVGARPASSLSFLEGPDSPVLLAETISANFKATVTRVGERPAVISRHQNTRLTYEQLDRLVDQAAFGLLQLGLEPGDRVGLWAQNCWEWVVAQYATARVGLVLVNINPAYRSTELEYALNKVGCKGLILAPAVKANSFVDTVYSLAPELKAQLPAESGTKASLARLPELEHVIVLGTEAFPGMLNFETICHSAISPSDVSALDFVSESLCEHDPINIQFTSGTTGKPKGATLTHHNVLNNGYITGRILAYSEADSVCIPVPMYHCFGMVLGTTACTTSGAAIVFPSETYEPQAVLEAVQEEQCTSLYGVPTMFIAELELSNFTEFDLSSLRTGIMAGSPCPEEIMRRVMTEMHIDEMTVCYGMTETSPVSFQSHRDDVLERRVSTVGQIHPHVQARVVHPDTEETLATGEKGELYTKGYLVMKGYWGDEEKTRAAITDDGWMRTGDMAVIDDDGYCRVVGRYKDMVIRGGENIYPTEVENLLYRHPDIADVQVVGVPDFKFGEELCACVILRQGADTLTSSDIKAFCDGKTSHFKIPRYCLIVDGYPTTVTGKIQKFVLRDIAANALGLSGDRAD